jgi:hypothetical protein
MNNLNIKLLEELRMKENIDEILNALRPRFEGDGGTMELTGIEEDGTVCLWQTEDEFSPEHVIWMHRLQAERAIKKVYPDAVVKVDMNFDIKL